MGEKYIKKIVNLTFLSEDWQSSTASAGGITSYTVKGEIKNTGLSEVRNAIIIAAIVNKKSNSTYQLLSKKLTIFKAADYSILPPVKSDNTLPFEISINFPPYNSLLFGKYGIKSLEDKIVKGDYKKKVFLIYDTKVLDDTTQDWFRDELLDNLKLIQPKWKAIHNAQKELTGYKCSGQIKNVGVKKISSFNVQGIIEDEYGKPFIIIDNSSEHKIQGNHEFEEILPNARLNFEFTCRIPSKDVLVAANITPESIESRIEKNELRTRIATAYLNYEKTKLTYRDTDESPTVIESEEGSKKIDILEQDWIFDDNQSEYTISGKIINSGSKDVENIYVIASILETESDKAIIWESTVDTVKTLVIEKIHYLKIKEESPFLLKLKIPTGKLFGNTKWNSKNIQQGITAGDLQQKVELYYTREDVYEEGMKRLRFGNSYFQLKNFRGCLREYSEGIKLVPDEKRFFLNISLCYYKLGEIQRAVDYANKALNVDGKYAKALYLLGLLYHSMKNYKEAFPYYQKAHAIEKDDPKILYNMGCINFNENKIDDGIQMLERATNYDKTQILSQMIKDPELRPVKTNPKFSDFLKDVREKEYLHK